MRAPIKPVDHKSTNNAGTNCPIETLDLGDIVWPLALKDGKGSVYRVALVLSITSLGFVIM
ncbi:hypothetical protein [Cohaesibacter celericrescens]|uniref:hypothetical protein n=1 Tax=Cohaesibacter celericrescens TaxID=2067669 RepID=UPI0015E104AF|nr:hypothetical protein [Cohaesibacter celericrescens]